MADKPTLYFGLKITAVAASFLIADNVKADMVLWIISALSFACVFVLELLLKRLTAKNNILLLTITASILACFVIGLDILFPLFIMLLFHLSDITVDRKMFYQIFSVTVVLSIVIFMPEKTLLVISLSLVAMALFCRALTHRLSMYIQINEEQKETIYEMDSKLKDLKGLIKTLKIAASLEERNRIAARIHDQIGHGISGSIIMLEAAMLVMKEDQEKATKSIGKAIINLREGVDDIRAALRDERAGRYQLGINDLTSILKEFKISYNKSTQIKTSGDLKNISLDVWSCIHDNLKECLTNLLKHSNATEFVLNIEVFKKIIKVEYKDNGKSKDAFEKDVGLEAIEERTVNTKGRCFFTKGENGFCVTNIFTY